MKKILVIGSLNVDMVLDVDHAPAVGETILTDRMTLVPGGKGANQACAAGRLGAEVTMLGAVGDDSYADLQTASLKEAGVDVTHLIRKQGEATGLAVITVERGGDNRIVVVSGANAALSPEDIDRNEELLRAAELVLLQLEIPLDTVIHAAKMAKQLGKTVILDPAPAPDVFPQELYPYVDIIKPNETELSGLTGLPCTGENIRKGAAWLREKGVRNVLVTLGEKGCYLDSEVFGSHMIPARQVKALDTTAAGDSFLGALAFMLAQDRSLPEAAEFAGSVAAFAVTRKGAQSSMPTLEEVLELRSGQAGI